MAEKSEQTKEAENVHTGDKNEEAFSFLLSPSLSLSLSLSLSISLSVPLNPAQTVCSFAMTLVLND